MQVNLLFLLCLLVLFNAFENINWRDVQGQHVTNNVDQARLKDSVTKWPVQNSLSTSQNTHNNA